MGISDKLQAEGGLESDGMKWVIAGVSLGAPLRPVKARVSRNEEAGEEEEEEEGEGCSTTPTSVDSRIPEKLLCPPAPRKSRPSLKCRSNARKGFFFVPPDLESVFVRRVEKTK